MANKCEHDIGLFHDCEGDWLITIDRLKEEQPNTVYTMKQYLDGRHSTNLYKFKYCPHCGEKIDWDKIRKEILGE